MSDTVAGASVAVVLVNWNGWRDTVECVDTLLMSTHRSFHVFIVDNQSKDDSVNHLKTWFERPVFDASWRAFGDVEHLTQALGDGPKPIPVRLIDWAGEQVPDAPPGCRVTIIRSGANRGFAGGNNVGIHAAGIPAHDFFWLLNTDTVVTPTSLASLVARAVANPRIGIAGSSLLHYDRPDRLQATGGGWNEARLHPYHLGADLPLDELRHLQQSLQEKMVYVVGASMLVSRAFLQSVGPMAEDYFLYYEELDWVARSKGRFDFVHEAASRVYHKGGSSSRKIQSKFSLEMLYQNRLRFVARHWPAKYARLRRVLAWEMVRFGLKRKFTHVGVIWSACRRSAQILREEQQRRAHAGPSVGALR